MIEIERERDEPENHKLIKITGDKGTVKQDSDINSEGVESTRRGVEASGVRS